MKILILCAAIAYGIWPGDLLPDIAPPLTYADDAVIVGAAVINLLRSKNK